MKTTRALMAFYYLGLFVWWIILYLHGSKYSLGNIYFSMGMGIFSLLFGGFFAYSLIDEKSLCTFVFPRLSIFLGMMFFGMATLLWFYYDLMYGFEVRFPSLADVFYVLQSPFTIVGLISFSSVCRCGDSACVHPKINKSAVKLSILFLFLLLLLIIVLAGVRVGGFLDWEKILMYHFVLESLAVSVLSVAIILKYHGNQRKISLFYIVMFGYITWFMADCFFFYEYLTGSFFNAGFSDLLYLTGSFAVLLGTSLIGTDNVKIVWTEEGPVYFNKLSYYVPVSMNIEKISG